jgi:hypothetical protein
LAFLVIAGLTNPKLPWTAPLNFGVSAVGFVVFQYRAIRDYLALDGSAARVFLFVADELLALVLLVALYFSVKTFRSKVIEKEPEQ